MDESKKIYKSKTIWVSVLTALAGFFPPIQALIIANPEMASVVVGGIFSILRLNTDKAVIKK